jgi:aspartate kinase
VSGDEGRRAMEEPIISGVVHDVGESKMTLLGVPDRPGVSALLFESLAHANVNVDMIVQNTSVDGTTDISFTLPAGDVAVAQPILERVGAEVGAKGVDTDAQIAKLSLVGAGMKTSPGVAAQMFRVLADNGVNIEMISTSTIRISVVVERAALNTAIVALHTAFGLDGDADYSAPLPERT